MSAIRRWAGVESRPDRLIETVLAGSVFGEVRIADARLWRNDARFGVDSNPTGCCPASHCVGAVVVGHSPAALGWVEC